MREQLPKREYKSAGGVVIDSAGERLLVLLRPKRLDQDDNPELRLPKGHIESGESRHEAAIREVSEETGLCGLEILVDLGHQTVEFVWKGYHYIRDESYFLMTITPEASSSLPEKQFEPMWLPWKDALEGLTFEAERDWVQRAWTAWQEYRSQTHSITPGS